MLRRIMNILSNSPNQRVVGEIDDGDAIVMAVVVGGIKLAVAPIENLGLLQEDLAANDVNKRDGLNPLCP